MKIFPRFSAERYAAGSTRTRFRRYVRKREYLANTHGRVLHGKDFLRENRAIELESRIRGISPVRKGENKGSGGARVEEKERINPWEMH